MLGAHEAVIDKLKMHDNGKAISGAAFLKNILGKLSSPLGLKLLNGFDNFLRRKIYMFLIRGIIVQPFKFGHQTVILILMQT